MGRTRKGSKWEPVVGGGVRGGRCKRGGGGSGGQGEGQGGRIGEEGWERSRVAGERR